MPELPEVETIKIGLAKLLPGFKITAVEHDWPKSFPNAESDVKEFLIGAKVKTVNRRAKVLIIDLDSDYSLVIHLKMTGQLVFRSDDYNFGAGHPNGSLIGKLPDKSTRVIFELSSKSGKAKLFFNDQRKFGWIRLIPSIEVPNIDFIKKVGPEPLNDDFTAKQFNERLKRRSNTSIKAAILDQTVVAGIGNIYADESLWGAKIHPATLVRNISTQKLNKLFEEIRFVLQLSIDKGGSTDKNYVDAVGKKGSYLSFARVFRREGQACPRCGTTIIKTRVAGRGTHLCPKEQKLLNKTTRLCGGAVFETPEGHHIFQLREDKPWINLPRKVHIFGGGAEGSEDGRQAMTREIFEETGISPERTKAASLICKIVERDDALKLDNLVEIYLITGVQPDEIEVLEGEGIVVVNEQTNLADHDFSETALHVLKLLGRQMQ